MKNRNAIKIKVWLLENRIEQKRIAAEVGVDRSHVSRTVNGQRNSREVLRWLLAKGCPEKFLALPEDMKNAA